MRNSKSTKPTRSTDSTFTYIAPPPPTVLINLPHLRDIKPQEIDGGEGTILIGMELTDAHDVVKSRMERQRKNVSMALFTPFGWCVVGKPGKSNPTRQHNISCFYTLH